MAPSWSLLLLFYLGKTYSQSTYIQCHMKYIGDAQLDRIYQEYIFKIDPILISLTNKDKSQNLKLIVFDNCNNSNITESYMEIYEIESNIEYFINTEYQHQTSCIQIFIQHNLIYKSCCSNSESIEMYNNNQNWFQSTSIVKIYDVVISSNINGHNYDKRLLV